MDRDLKSTGLEIKKGLFFDILMVNWEQSHFKTVTLWLAYSLDKTSICIVLKDVLRTMPGSDVLTTSPPKTVLRPIIILYCPTVCCQYMECQILSICCTYVYVA